MAARTFCSRRFSNEHSATCSFSLRVFISVYRLAGIVIMLNSSIKTILTLVFLSVFGLWGCVANETRTSPAEDAVQDEGTVPAETKVSAGSAEKTVSSVIEDSQMEKPEPASVETMAAKAVREPAISVEQHVITLVKKDPSHPAYGKGHAMGFSIDGVPGKSIVLERGKTYTFVIKTDPKHDVYLSSKEIGWGSAPVVEGVQGAYTYKGTMTFTPGKNTPDKVWQRQHPRRHSRYLKQRSSKS